MRILVCGDRNWNDYPLLSSTLTDIIVVTPSVKPVIIHGAARGADTMAGKYARHWGFVEWAFPAYWKVYGKAAGPIRNNQMIMEGQPDRVVAFHDDINHSRGTKDMVSRATQYGIPVQIVTH